MYLGKKAKSRTPVCDHKEWPLEIFRIQWMEVEEGLRSKPHLHCDTCGITAKDALPKKKAQEFKGYYDKPERVQVCHECQYQHSVEYSDTDCLDDSRDIDWYRCDICGGTIQGEYPNGAYN